VWDLLQRLDRQTRWRVVRWVCETPICTYAAGRQRAVACFGQARTLLPESGGIVD
jgi:hypothetical protein